ncbi:envelope glycoprotein E [Pteropodid alphaherpesvirus 1]|uniref:Envelope glycoprotein E n=1 Tax=Pteropodid alphaherpesvirus 1 TaxID=1343901 RepID=A0A060Q505_9ALPH|nr:envelope glycoprotein E [Pteropodid alphaherpesvirus 1]BAP00745.1 envelope glycoprotein E [Pteropodid alphaherpesvirus 1]
MWRATFFVILGIGWGLGRQAATATVWQTANLGDNVTLFAQIAIPSHGLQDPPVSKLVWGYAGTSRCGMVQPIWVAIHPPRRVKVAVIEPDCMDNPSVLAIQYTRGHSQVFPMNVTSPRLTIDGHTLLLHDVRQTDSGLYTLTGITSPEGRPWQQDVFLEVREVPFIPDDELPPLDDESIELPTPDFNGMPITPPASPETRVPLPGGPPAAPSISPVADVHHVRGVSVSLSTPNTLLFTEGQSFNTDVVIHAISHDDQQYSMEIVWIQHPFPAGCSEMQIFEACLYHPRLPECLEPADARCAISSWTHYLGTQRYLGCSRRATPPNCPSESMLDRGSGITWHGTSTNLHFHNASASTSGVYLCVVYIDGHVAAWSYITITTTEKFIPVHVETRLPRQRPASPPSFPNFPRPKTTSASGHFHPLLLVLGLAIALSVVCLVTWGCVTCWRARAWRAVKRHNPKGPTYIRVADHELYADFSSDSEVEFDDSFRLGRLDDATSPRGGSGFEILSPSSSSVYPQNEKSQSRRSFSTFKPHGSNGYSHLPSPDSPRARW